VSHNPHQVTRDFEAALCEYTGAPYAVAVTSCTMALLLAVAWHLRGWNPARNGHNGGSSASRMNVEIPKRTYVSVPMSIIHAGGRPTFRDEEWRGAYQLKPLPVWDSARWFTAGCT
jgi:dTDP-4-amino-4,6-dideoxygalactose transaminase